MRPRFKEVILTLEGALLRVPIPDFSHNRMPWEAQYKTPGGRYVSRTIAEAMRREYVLAIERKWRELERAERERKFQRYER